MRTFYSNFRFLVSFASSTNLLYSTQKKHVFMAAALPAIAILFTDDTLNPYYIMLRIVK